MRTLAARQVDRLLCQLLVLGRDRVLPARQGAAQAATDPDLLGRCLLLQLRRLLWLLLLLLLLLLAPTPGPAETTAKKAAAALLLRLRRAAVGDIAISPILNPFPSACSLLLGLQHILAGAML